jgi:HEPN domain-containing protein
MPHDPEFVAETRAWLDRAEKDLRAADVLRRAQPPLLDDALYHCQQSAEKALKGFLAWHGRTFRKTHNLSELGQGALEVASDLTDIMHRAASLTAYAWRFRYPGEPEPASPGEVEVALALAREVLDAILARLPDEVRRGL